MKYDIDSARGGFLREGASSYMDASMATDRELLSVLAPDKADMEKSGSVIGTLFSGNDDISLDDLGISDRFKDILRSAIELGRRTGCRKARRITDPADAYRELRHFALDESRERAAVLLLNGGLEVQKAYIAAEGLADSVKVHPREVYGEAVRTGSVYAMIAHNHPSGLMDPSPNDKEITERLKSAGNIIGIKLLDHLIITPDGYYSFLEHGLL